MEPGLHLSSQATGMHLQGTFTRRAGDPPGDYRGSGGESAKFQGAKREATGVAKRRVGIRGRSIFGIVLGAFIVVALIIVWRRSFGIAESRGVQQLDRKRSELEGERARLESEIRDLSSRQRLGPVVEQRLGMHVPSGRQVVILSRQARHATP
jgi:cell division protein FtsL